MGSSAEFVGERCMYQFSSANSGLGVLAVGRVVPSACIRVWQWVQTALDHFPAMG